MKKLTSELLTELGLDDTADNQSLINSLVADAQILTLSSIGASKKVDDYQDNNLFDRAVKTLATQLFYDRTLANGTSIGYQMMVTHLQMGVLPDADEDVSTVSDDQDG